MKNEASPSASLAPFCAQGSSSALLSVEQAADYYVQRLAGLVACATGLSAEQANVVTYQELIEQTDPTLQRLQAFLQLEQAFTEQYPLQHFTGVRGDPSATIQTGRVVRNKTRDLVLLWYFKTDQRTLSR